MFIFECLYIMFNVYVVIGISVMFFIVIIDDIDVMK